MVYHIYNTLNDGPSVYFLSVLGICDAMCVCAIDKWCICLFLLFKEHMNSDLNCTLITCLARDCVILRLIKIKKTFTKNFVQKVIYYAV